MKLMYDIQGIVDLAVASTFLYLLWALVTSSKDIVRDNPSFKNVLTFIILLTVLLGMCAVMVVLSIHFLTIFFTKN